MSLSSSQIYFTKKNPHDLTRNQNDIEKGVVVGIQHIHQEHSDMVLVFGQPTLPWCDRMCIKCMGEQRFSNCKTITQRILIHSIMIISFTALSWVTGAIFKNANDLGCAFNCQSLLGHMTNIAVGSVIVLFGILFCMIFCSCASLCIIGCFGIGTSQINEGHIDV